MAKETNLSKKDVEDVLKSFVDVVSKELKNGGKIQLVGFGTFEDVYKRQIVYDCDKYADTPAVIASKRMLDAAGVRYYKYNRTGRKITIEV